MKAMWNRITQRMARSAHSIDHRFLARRPADEMTPVRLHAEKAVERRSEGAEIRHYKLMTTESKILFLEDHDYGDDNSGEGTRRRIKVVEVLRPLDLAFSNK